MDYLVPNLRYELVDQIGEGSHARVYKALRTDVQFGLQQTVAIKILKSQKWVDNWKREFASLSQIRSPYCVQIFGFESWKGQPALILEYIEGLPLQDLVDISHGEIDEILRQVQEGLKDLAGQGSFHGDLSPANILVDVKGRIRLVDFGLGNTSESEVSTTLEYAAPELLIGGRPNLQSDLFALARIEQKLRARLAPVTCLMMAANLSDSPTARVVQFIGENAAAQSQLAARVYQSLQAQGRNAAATAQITLQPTYFSRYQYAFLLFIAVVIGLTFASMSLLRPPQSQTIPSISATIEPPKELAQVSVHTKSWLRISINGKDYGFTPIRKVSITSGPALIQWKGLRAAGQRTLTLRPNQNTVLSDTFFQGDTNGRSRAGSYTDTRNFGR